MKKVGVYNMGYAISQTSMAHTYGNVTCQIVDYIKNLFPNNYFKTVHISSTIAYREFNIFNNTNKEFLKKNKPMLIVRPRFELDDSNVFLYDTFLTTRMTDNYMDRGFTNLQPFIEDRERGNCMKFLLNRLKMVFDVTIVVETLVEQLNMVHYFKNRVRQNAPFFINTALESYIPRELMIVMSKDIDIPIDNISSFLEYVNGVSIYPITYKLKNSSGNDEFFRHYPVNIYTSINNLSIDDGSKRGQVYDTYTISFSVSTEFNATGLYYYFASKPNLIDECTFNIMDADQSKIIPLFTITDLDMRRPADGWNVYTAPIYKVLEKPDIIEFESLINNSLKFALEYHKKHNIPSSVFLKYRVTQDNRDLQEGKDYKIDFDEFKLTTYVYNTNSTFRLIIYINTLYINELIQNIFDFNAEK